MSEQYLVSARKYRPQTFDTVVGQSHITTTLKNAIRTQHLAHAYLFCGPRGVGKTTCARILSKTINCVSPTADMEACGECEMCQTFNENASFNVFELDGASNNSVDDIRSLTEQVRFAPQMGKYKVYIIDEVHMLTSAAFNAFLKTLEEPPPYAIFILATTEKHKILPTILSRCQIFDFKRIQSADIVGHLNNICNKEGVVAEEAGLHIIAQKSEGCMRDALSMMDRISSFSNGHLTYDQAIEHLNVLDAGFYFKLLDALLTTNVADVLLLLDEVYRRGFEGDAILNGFAQHLRDLLLCKDPKMTRLLDIPEAHKRSFFDKAQMLSMSFITSALNVINDAEVNYKTTLNKRLHLEVYFIKLCYLTQVVTASSLQDAKKKSDDLEIPQAAAPAARSFNAPVMPVSAPPGVPAMPEPAPARSLSTAINTTPAAPVTAVPGVPPVVPPENAAAAPPPIPKFGKDFLKQVQAQAGEAVGNMEEKQIDQELGVQLFEQYVQHLRDDADKQLQSSNLSTAKIIVRENNLVTIICNSNMGAIYANGNVDAFREFCKEKTNNNSVKIAVALAPEAERVESAPQKMSSADIFALYASQNPALKRLRDELRLDLK
ncbi:MAG: DNA polymerase III subunit gamma/tau [Sphingobacteriales bacterium]|nr:MAG: DNA polymerase III subunit gamma/tau [Sphingobacteriales bacterium]